jgi:hypothetical protein
MEGAAAGTKDRLRVGLWVRALTANCEKQTAKQQTATAELQQP